MLLGSVITPHSQIPVPHANNVLLVMPQVHKGPRSSSPAWPTSLHPRPRIVGTAQSPHAHTTAKHPRDAGFNSRAFGFMWTFT